MEIEVVCIVGSGLMGSGIAQVCAQSGVRVFLNDITEDALQKGFKSIEWSVSKLIEKGKLDEDRETILGRIETTTELTAAADADLVIEAVFEKMDLKKEIFRAVDEVCKPSTVLASNTSAIPITDLAAATENPERVLGLHFFSPVPMMQVVEVISGTLTSPQTMETGVGFIRKVGKEPIRVERDIPGFLLNRINLLSYVEAVQLVESGVGTVEDIDKGFRLAFGRKMGPFETGDLVGLDVSYRALMAIYAESKDKRYYPPLLLRHKVKAGILGRKTGEGWYKYDRKDTEKGT